MLTVLEIPGIEGKLPFEVHDGVDTCVSRQILDHGIWEPYETSLVVENLTRDGVFLDIGANIGYYTLIASILAGDKGKVIAYEPDEENFALLQRNLELNECRNVMAFCGALSDREGAGKIYLDEDNRGDHRIYDTGDRRRTRDIRIMDASTHVPSLTDRVDFIKIDTQGSEASILRGLSSVCLDNRDRLRIIVEFWPYGLRQAGESGHALLETLRLLDIPGFIIDHLGFSLMPIDMDGLEEWVSQTDQTPDNQGFINLFMSSL